MADTPDDQDRTTEDLHEIAQETSRRIQPPDPYTEPPNSTVDDWLGQRVARDMEQAPEPGDPDAPGTGVDAPEGEEIPEPNEPG